MPYSVSRMRRGMSRRDRTLGHQKGSAISISKGTPKSTEGSEGDMTLRKTSKGLILYVKYGSRWYDINNLQAKKTEDVMTVVSGSASANNNVNVTGISKIFADTSSYDYVIGGFTGGVLGQVLHIVKTSTSNDLKLEHNEASNTQKIFIPDVTDLEYVNTDYGGIVLVCDGSSWYTSGIAHQYSNDT